MILSALLIASISTVYAGANPLSTQTDPVLLIGAYYRAINAGDYATAYSYWQQPGAQTEQQFAQGFADTTSASVLVRLPVFVDAGAGNFFADVPAWITATHVDGSTHYYAGCFTLHKTDVPIGNATEPDLNWYIRQGDLREQQTLDLSVLDTTCQNSPSLGSSEMLPAQQTSPRAVIQAYFDAVASARTIPTAVAAAGYWLRPGGDAFQIGYSDQLVASSGLELYLDPEVTFATTPQAAFPVLVNITAPDKSSLLLTGCLSTAALDIPSGNLTSANPNWYITDGTMTRASNAAAAFNALATVCTP